MEQDRQGQEHGDRPAVERALEEVSKAERELEKAHKAEEIAEEDLRKAVRDLKDAEHNQPRSIELIVNTRAKPWSETTISYDQVVALAALPLPTGPNPGFLVVFEEGPDKNPSGTLVTGQSVRVKNEMVFHVTPTNRS